MNINIFRDFFGFISYITLGILFFFIIWGFSQKICENIFPNKGLGQVLGFLMAAYGFWYPFMPLLRIPYLVFLSVVAICSTGISRVSIVTTWASRHNRIMATAVVLALIVFEGIHYAVPKVLQESGYTLLGNIISWALLVYGITGIKFIGPVIKDMELPRANFIQAVFILACAVFLPLEFPMIYVLMSGAAIVGSIIGWRMCC
jgi:hypothetical protein